MLLKIKPEIMRLKFLPVLILLFITASTSSAQEIKWSETKHWRLYKLNNRAAFNYSVDTLQHFKSIVLDDTVVHSFLSSTSTWPQEKKSVWMGLMIATYETNDNILCKVNISNYGGFFFDERSKRYYQLPEASRGDWLSFLNNALDKLFTE